MTDIPAGWYTDPEDNAQLRYWDGSQWSDHRAPAVAPSDVAGGDSMAIVTGAVALCRDNWVQLLIIAALGVAIAVSGIVLGVIGLSTSLDPGLWDIITTVTDSNYNPEFDPVDRAFEDSIMWEWNVGVVLLVISALLLFGGMYGSLAAATLLLASARAGQPRGAVSCLGMVLRRAPRWIAIAILWSLVATVLGGILVGLYVLTVLAAQPLLFLLIPATIALAIFGWPFLQLSGVALILAPRGTPPFRHVISLVTANWGGIALRSLIINISVFVFNFASNIIGIIPIVGILVVLVAGVAIYAYQVAASVLLYEYAGGEVDPEILEPVTAQPVV
jgi:hypothetical protein